MPINSIIAVDIGNTRIKIGSFPDLHVEGKLPLPIKVEHLRADQRLEKELANWSGANPTGSWIVASVQRETCQRLTSWLKTQRPQARVHFLSWEELLLDARVDFPEKVGVDRLVTALAVKELKEPGLPAVVCDLGTAVTWDFISAEGVFLGGAIFPGWEMSARAMHEFTDLLPKIDLTAIQTSPSLIGQHTESAMRAGIFWALVGALQTMADRSQQELGAAPQIFLTGGAARLVAPHITPRPQVFPDLTLSGIALAAKQLP